MDETTVGLFLDHVDRGIRAGMDEVKETNDRETGC